MQKLLDRVAELRVGDPMLPDTRIGPKVNQQEVERIDAQVQDAVAQGATLECGGSRADVGGFPNGAWYQPTVLTDVAHDMDVAQIETFGPVLPVFRISGIDEAIRLANDSPFGLSAYLHTTDLKVIDQCIDELEAGEFYINRGIGEQHQGFHNGLKLSGCGGEDGKYGLEQYLEKKTVYLATS